MSKRVIDGLDGFRALVGETIGTSGLVEVTQQRIEQFCESVDNDEWIHWDVERCKASPFGNTIAPSMYTLAYFSKLFFEMVEIENVPNMLFLGSDRVRLLAPLVCGEKFNITVKLDRVEEKKNGINAFYESTWNVEGKEAPIAIGLFIIRYMDS